jgi:hypothetical protein
MKLISSQIKDQGDTCPIPLRCDSKKMARLSPRGTALYTTITLHLHLRLPTPLVCLVWACQVQDSVCHLRLGWDLDHNSCRLREDRALMACFLRNECKRLRVDPHIQGHLSPLIPHTTWEHFRLRCVNHRQGSRAGLLDIQVCLLWVPVPTGLDHRPECSAPLLLLLGRRVHLAPREHPWPLRWLCDQCHRVQTGITMRAIHLRPHQYKQDLQRLQSLRKCDAKCS